MGVSDHQRLLRVGVRTSSNENVRPSPSRMVAGTTARYAELTPRKSLAPRSVSACRLPFLPGFEVSAEQIQEGRG